MDQMKSKFAIAIPNAKSQVYANAPSSRSQVYQNEGILNQDLCNLLHEVLYFLDGRIFFLGEQTAL